MSKLMRKVSKGFTLIELLIAMGIASLLGVTIVFMFQTAFDAYLFSEEQAFMYKILDDVLEKVSGEDFKQYGIKDALQILEANPDSISFSCLWIDELRCSKGKQEKFTLSRPYKLGSPIPICEFRINNSEDFQPMPITFISRNTDIRDKSQDIVIPGKELPAGAQVRIIFEPEVEDISDVIMKITWQPERGGFLRTYKNKSEVIPRNRYHGFKVIQARFQYFDNTNTEIPAPVPEELLSLISAVRFSLIVEKEDGEKKREGTTFINLRNSRGTGKGLTIRKGTKIKIPDSRNIQTFSLGNIAGVNDGDIIQLKTQTEEGKSWRITLRLAINNNLGVIERYTIEYPAGVIVYSEKIDQTIDLPFNFLTIGRNGRYDYDYDSDVENVVDLEGSVFLEVEEMTVQGAAIFVRP